MQVKRDNSQRIGFLKRLKAFFELKLQKLKSGPVKCPFCDHLFDNYSEMRAHLKVQHCCSQ